MSRSDFFADQKKPFRTDGNGMGQKRFFLCPENLIKVRPIQIEEAEFLALKSQMAASQAENKALRQEIDSLKAQLDEQSSLLQQILAKL